MKIIADTNVLLRAYVDDDREQSLAAVDILTHAESVAVSLQSLCEFSWILSRQYKSSQVNISTAIRALFNTANVVVSHHVAYQARETRSSFTLARVT